MTSRFPLGWRLVASLVLVTLWLIALYAAKVGVPFVLRLSPSDIGHEQGSAYIAKVSPPPRHALFRRSVDAIGPPASKARLFEDGRPLGPSHTPRSFIRDPGHGRFFDWNGQLYFSASDNT